MVKESSLYAMAQTVGIPSMTKDKFMASFEPGGGGGGEGEGREVFD